MFIDAYLVREYKTTEGIGILQVKINNVYETIVFKEREHAKKIIDRIKRHNKKIELHIEHLTKIYIDNKIIYEENPSTIDLIDSNLFSTI